MPLVTVHPTTESDVLELRDIMRQEDVCEILRMGLSVRRALWLSVRSTLNPKTVFVDGKIAAIYGCSGPPLGLIGTPWLLTSPVCDDNPLSFALFYRREVRKMLKDFPILENRVDAAHQKAIKLLELIGFHVYDAEDDKTYRVFRMSAP